MQLKLVSDGTPLGTKVVDENGEVIEYITNLKWEIGVGHYAKATIEITKLPLEVVGELKQ